MVSLGVGTGARARARTSTARAATMRTSGAIDRAAATLAGVDEAIATCLTGCLATAASTVFNVTGGPRRAVLRASGYAARDVANSSKSTLLLAAVLSAAKVALTE